MVLDVINATQMELAILAIQGMPWLRVDIASNVWMVVQNAIVMRCTNVWEDVYKEHTEVETTSV